LPGEGVHSERQRFRFDVESSLLRRHDFVADALASPRATAARVVLTHGMADGIPYPASQRVMFRGADGRPTRLEMVRIEFEGYRLT
jgi:hypothetical protein